MPKILAKNIFVDRGYQRSKEALLNINKSKGELKVVQSHIIKEVTTVFNSTSGDN